MCRPASQGPVPQKLDGADPEHVISRAGPRAGSEKRSQAFRIGEWLRGAGIPFIVRVPCIPGVNDTPADREALLRLAGSSPTMQGVEFLPYNAAAPAKYAMLGRAYPLAPSISSP